MAVNDKLTFGGHTWYDRVDGVFIPDEEYEVGEWFCLGEECEGKTFLTKTTEDGRRILISLTVAMSAWPAMWQLQDELNEKVNRLCVLVVGTRTGLVV